MEAILTELGKQGPFGLLAVGLVYVALKLYNETKTQDREHREEVAQVRARYEAELKTERDKYQVLMDRHAIKAENFGEKAIAQGEAMNELLGRMVAAAEAKRGRRERDERGTQVYGAQPGSTPPTRRG